MPFARFIRERALERRGVWPVAGIDEAGRGPLAGPVCAAAVILDPSRVPKGLADSKVLAGPIREALYETIVERAVSVSVAFASAGEIDALNIRQATLLAMRRAVFGLSIQPRYALIDGNDKPANLPCDGETIIAGDASSASIAAASIVAKVTRDRLMRRVCAIHPEYGFSRHVGYGTRHHLTALAANGPCPFHRLSFAPVRAVAMGRSAV